MKYQISKKEEGVMVISGCPVLTFGEWQVILARALKVQVTPTLSLCQMGAIANALSIGTTMFLDSTLSLEQSTVLARHGRPGSYLYVAQDILPKTLMAIASCTRQGVMVLLDSRMPVENVDQFVAALRPGPVLLVNIDMLAQVMVRMASQVRPGCCLAVPCSIDLQTTVAIVRVMRPGTFLLLGLGLSSHAINCIHSYLPLGVTLLRTPMSHGFRFKGSSSLQGGVCQHGPTVAHMQPAGVFYSTATSSRCMTGFSNPVRAGGAGGHAKSRVPALLSAQQSLLHNGVTLYQSACIEKKKKSINNASLLAWMAQKRRPDLSRDEVMVVDVLMEMGRAASQPKKESPTTGTKQLISGLI